MGMPTGDSGDIARYRGLIVAALPQLATTPLQVLHRGADCAAIAADDTILKLPRTADAAIKLRREAMLLDYLRPRVTMALPQMQIVDGTPPISTHRRIAGIPLDTESYEALDTGRRNAIALRLAGFFTELHHLPLPRLTAIGAVPAMPWLGPDAILTATLPLLPRKLHAFVRRTLRAYRSLTIAGEELVFGQFGTDGDNMAIDPATGLMSGVFDFSDAGFGARHRDLSYPMRISIDLGMRIIERYEELGAPRVDRALVLTYASVDRLARIATGAMPVDADEMTAFVAAVEAIVPPPPPKARRPPAAPKPVAAKSKMARPKSRSA
jgi:aminoglycoside phosphotransferase (APT) family kinase protein